MYFPSCVVCTIFLLLFQIKVYYRQSAFADMKKNCSFSRERKDAISGATRCKNLGKTLMMMFALENDENSQFLL